MSTTAAINMAGKEMLPTLHPAVLFIIALIIFFLAGWLLSLWACSICDQRGRYIMSSPTIWAIYWLFAFSLVGLIFTPGIAFWFLLIVLLLIGLFTCSCGYACGNSCCGRVGPQECDPCTNWPGETRCSAEILVYSNYFYYCSQPQYRFYVWTQLFYEFVLGIIGIFIGSVIVSYFIVSDGVYIGVESSAWMFWILALIIGLILIFLYWWLVYLIASSRVRQILLNFRTWTILGIIYWTYIGMSSGAPFVCVFIAAILWELLVTLCWCCCPFQCTGDYRPLWVRFFENVIFYSVAAWIGAFFLRPALICNRVGLWSI